MDRLSSFICYADEECSFAEELNTCLTKTFGFDSFFAKKSLIPSTDFIPALKKAVKNTDLLIALISKNHIISPYANQEIGMAYAWGKTILPVMLDENNPCGFINGTQGIPFEKENTDPFGLAMKIFYLCVGDLPSKEMNRKARSSIINALKANTDFSYTRPIMKIMTHIHTFTASDLDEIKIISNKNRAIHQEQYAYPTFKSFLLKKYGLNVDS